MSDIGEASALETLRLLGFGEPTPKAHIRGFRVRWCCGLWDFGCWADRVLQPWGLRSRVQD